MSMSARMALTMCRRIESLRSGADCCVLPRDEYIRVTGDESLTMLKQVKASYVTGGAVM